jgi:hypothetical protein
MSSALIKFPTWAVQALRSPRSASHILHRKRRPPVWQSLPVLRSMLRWLIRRHVSAEIQSFPPLLWGSALTHVSFSALKVWVNSSCSSVGSHRGRRCLRRWYAVSRRPFLAQNVGITAQWSESWTSGNQNTIFPKYQILPSLAIM